MTMFKRVNGVRVKMAPEEEQAILKEWSKASTKKELGAKMVVTRTEFAKAAKRKGIISHAEAIAWATQKALPQIVLNVFAMLPQADREDAEFEALTSERVQRTAPLITMLQGELSLTDAQVDALFEDPDP